MSPRTEYPVATMRRAVELRTGGWELERVRELLIAEGLDAPTIKTIQRWCNPEWAARELGLRRAYKRRAGARVSRFRLSSNTPEYRLAFMQILRQQGVSCNDIGIVHGVVFGERLTSGQVRYFFRDHDPKPSVVAKRAAA